MGECRWDCPQSINGLAPLGTDAWEPSDGHTERGFALAAFRDSYGQSCSVQQSSNVEPHLWVGVDCCRMHLTPAQARGLATRLIAFADAEEAVPNHQDSCDALYSTDADCSCSECRT